MFLERKAPKDLAQHIIEDLGVVTPGATTPVRRLSGGNVQKVLVGREIDAGPNVIITAYPVRGLDINSSYTIYNILNDEKKKGVGILFVGEDLDVMLSLCDKIMVICHGNLQGVVNSDHTTKEDIGLMMTGTLNIVNKEGKTDGIAKDSAITDEEGKA
jgi:simple sugar transport system ATP-binding protein